VSCYFWFIAHLSNKYRQVSLRVMAELAKGLHLVDGVGSGNSLRNVTAILDDDIVHLVDCGDPGSAGRIFRYLEGQSRKPSDLRTLILTHFDSDHVGSAAEIKRRTGCTVIAREFDAEIISGRRFTDRELKKMLPDYDPVEIEALQGKINGQEIPSVAVDRVLRGDEKLEIAGGAQIVHIPGHTPGHVVVLLPIVSALITGDTLSAPSGRIGGPTPQYTPSVRLATQSLKKLSKFEFEILVPYHWPPITAGASILLKKYLSSIDRDPKRT
jgi:glyoxylase-like metal-dependent hydrolase (beta-lactamase superfamily II)